MNLNPELLKKARGAKSPQELETMAQEAGISLTGEKAHAVYHSMHKTGSLADDELDNVAGGCGNEEESLQYELNKKRCPYCDKYSLREGTLNEMNNGHFIVCKNCGQKWDWGKACKDGLR